MYDAQPDRSDNGCQESRTQPGDSVRCGNGTKVRQALFEGLEIEADACGEEDPETNESLQK